MAQPPKKKTADKSDIKSINLEEVDRFLEGGLDAVSPAMRRQAAEEVRGKGSSLAAAEKPAKEKPVPEKSKPKEVSPVRKKERPTVSLDLEDEGFKAVVWVIHPENIEQDILDALQRNKVTEGILYEAIHKALERVQKTGESLRSVLVAQAIAPVQPQPPRMEHCVPAELKGLPPESTITRLLNMDNIEVLEQAAGAVRAWAVGPGDRVAMRVVDQGKPGCDVCGNPVLPTPLDDVDDLEKYGHLPGPGVAISADRADYQAKIYGYAVALSDRRVAVLPPIWISPDGMSAYLLNLSRVSVSRAPEPADLKSLLADAGVSFGIDEKAILDVCNGLRQGHPQKTLVALAVGRPPVLPPEIVPTFHFAHQSRIGKILPDGGIDYRERNLFPQVEQGALIAECSPLVRGTPGMSVRGETLSVPDPIVVDLAAGDYVRREVEDGVQKLYADMTGGANLQVAGTVKRDVKTKIYTVSVRNLAQIEGDVNYKTGNLDYRGNVEIKGSVIGGFRVVATGDVVIGGLVEAGANVQAGGSIVVSQGVVGAQTKITAKGTVMAKFVQDASIEADGDVVVGSYIHNAQIRTKGRVLMEGRGGSGGSIIGGEIWAVRGIVSRNIGSELNAATVLSVGISPEIFAKLEKMQQSVAQADVLLRNILKAIGLETLQAEEVKALIAKMPGRAKHILYHVQKAKQLADVRQKYVQEQTGFETEILQAAKNAVIEVVDTAYARIKMRIGHDYLQLTKSLKRVRFSADTTNKKGGIVATGF